LKPLKDRLCEIDDGRFQNIINSMEVTPECENCQCFNYTADDSYLCAVTPYCIGDTFSDKVKSYLLYKLDIISYEEHLKNCEL